MMVICCCIALPAVVGYYNYFREGADILYTLRNTLIALGFGVMMSFPIGEVTEREFIPEGEISGSLNYVVPCEHQIENGGQLVRGTSVSTSWLAYCLNEDETEVIYCPICHTRKEAITLYTKEK